MGNFIHGQIKSTSVLPPSAIERTAQILAQSPARQALELRTYSVFNTALFAKFAGQRNAYPGVRLVLMDTVALFSSMMDYPKALGAPNATCVGKDDGCLWSDGFRLAPRMHRVIAQRVVEVLGKVGPGFFGEK